MADYQREIFGVITKTYKDMGDGSHSEVTYTKVGEVAISEDAPLVGQVAIAVTGTAVPLSATSIPIPTGGITITAHSGNAADGAAGGADVENTVDGSGNGMIVEAGKAAILFAEDLNQVYVNGTAGDIFSFSAG